jgi:hypothetical protein
MQTQSVQISLKMLLQQITILTIHPYFLGIRKNCFTFISIIQIFM